MYKYPYGDSQQLNLDWIISKIKELEAGGSGGAADLEAVANALVTLSFNLNTQYRRYDYCFLNGKLYRCLSDTSGVFDPSAWQEALIGDDLAVLTRWINAIDAAAVVDVKFDTSGTNGKLQQKYHDEYHDVVEVDYTPVQNSKRPLSSNAGYELNGALTSIQNHFKSDSVNWRDYASITSALSANWNTFTDSAITIRYAILSGGYPHIIIAYKNGNNGYVWHQTQSSPIEILYTNDNGSTWTTRNFENVTTNSITPISNANFQVDDTASVPFKYDKNERLIIVRAVIKCLNNVSGWQAIGTVPPVIGTNPNQNMSVQFMWQDYENGTYANGLIQGTTLYIKNATEVGKYYGCTVSYFET